MSLKLRSSIDLGQAMCYSQGRFGQSALSANVLHKVFMLSASCSTSLVSHVTPIVVWYGMAADVFNRVCGIFHIFCTSS